MALRTTKFSVTFTQPWQIKGVEGQQPAGTYAIETEEEAMETPSHTVYVRVATLLYIRTVGMTRTVTVEPGELEAALERDRNSAS